MFQHTAARRRLVGSVGAGFRCFVGFNTQPPKGGWNFFGEHGRSANVSTHSRLKAAGYDFEEAINAGLVSTHSRLKAAGRQYSLILSASLCFNTQPPKGGWQEFVEFSRNNRTVSTHSRLKAAGWLD